MSASGTLTRCWIQRAKNLLVGRVGRDLHAADVARAVGRLVQQQRARRIAAIHERSQREAERVNLFCARRLRREVQPRARRDSFVGMARTAAGFFEHRIHRRGKRRSRRLRLDDEKASPDRTAPHSRRQRGSEEQDPHTPGLVDPGTYDPSVILCTPRALLLIRPAAPSVRDGFPRKSRLTHVAA